MTSNSRNVWSLDARPSRSYQWYFHTATFFSREGFINFRSRIQFLKLGRWLERWGGRGFPENWNYRSSWQKQRWAKPPPLRIRVVTNVTAAARCQRKSLKPNVSTARTTWHIRSIALAFSCGYELKYAIAIVAFHVGDISIRAIYAPMVNMWLINVTIALTASTTTYSGNITGKKHVGTVVNGGKRACDPPVMRSNTKVKLTAAPVTKRFQWKIPSKSTTHNLFF